MMEVAEDGVVYILVVAIEKKFSVGTLKKKQRYVVCT